MSAGLNSVRKRGMSGRILTESGLQFLNCTIKVLLLSAIFVPCPAALRECFPCKRSSLWSIWGGQTTTWHSSELKNVSCWFIFSGAVPSLCSRNQFWEKNGNSLENRNQVLFFLHFHTHRQLQGRAGVSLGVNCISMSDYSQYTPVPKMQISAMRKVHFCRFKPKPYPHQLDYFRRTLWIPSLTFVPGLLSPPPDLAGALPEPSPSCCRAGIWGAEWANQGKTCFPSPPALEFPAAGPGGERQKVSALSVRFTGVWSQACFAEGQLLTFLLPFWIRSLFLFATYGKFPYRIICKLTDNTRSTEAILK